MSEPLTPESPSDCCCSPALVYGPFEVYVAGRLFGAIETDCDGRANFVPRPPEDGQPLMREL